MTNLLKKLSPFKSLSGQIILLVLGVLILTQILNVAFLIGERRAVSRNAHFDMVMDRMVAETLSLPEISDVQLPMPVLEDPSFQGAMFLSGKNRTALEATKLNTDLAETLRLRFARSGIEPLNIKVGTRRLKNVGKPPFEGRPPPPPNSTRPMPRHDDGLYHPKGRPKGAKGSGAGLEEVIMSAELAPGIWFNTLAPHYSVETLTRRALWLTLLSSLFGSVAAIWLARRLLRPVNALSQAAERLARGQMIEPIAEQGPHDMRRATRAFNDMQSQLTRQIEEQRATLRAVGHDLRTPLTSLRLRAEDVPKDAGRDKIIASLDQMATMTEEILNWSRLTGQLEKFAQTDLTSVLDSIAQDYVETGRPVTFISPEEPIIRAVRRAGLRRAITNLIDNALAYAGTAELSLQTTKETVEIYVEDNGPGIPEAQMDLAMSPFQRLESSRNRNTGGTGLGLSIVRTLVQGQGGTLRLENRLNGPKGSGLKAIITLPRKLRQS